MVTKTVDLRIAGRDYRIRRLIDRNQYADDDGRAERAGVPPASWSLFGVFWPSGIALAEEMSAFPIEGKRILEVGCGLALPSIVLKRRGADITATDYHPEVEEFLRYNTAANGLPAIDFHLARWEDADLGRFDLIIGADLLYEPGQPPQLAAFIARHAAPGAEVIIADPGRRQLGEFNQQMRQAGFLLETRHVPPSIRLVRYRTAA